MFSNQNSLKYLLVLAFLLNFSPTHSVKAQTGATTGTLVGIVKDRTEAVISGAKVIARRVETNFTQEITSQENGSYVFIQLPPGKYEISVQADGFTPTKEPVILTLGTTALLDFSLQIEGSTNVVEVIAGQNLEPKTESSTNIEQDRIVTLPTQQRDFLELSLIAPRITVDRLPNNGIVATSGISANSQSGRFNNITIDGLDNNDHVTGAFRSVFGQDGIQEFQVITDSYNAEFGRVLGGIVNIITRGGGNTFQGESFFTNRNDKIAARDAFSPLKKQILDQYQFGVLLSGPIKKDKTFLFTSFERLTSQQSNVVNLTRDAVRAATNQGFPVRSGPIPYALGTTSVLARLDTQISPNDTLWIRYNGGFTYNGAFQEFRGLVAETAGGIQQLSDNTIAVSNTYSNTELNLVNETRFLFGRRSQDILPISNQGPQIQLTPREGTVLLGRNVFLPQSREENIYQFVSNFVLPRGKNIFKFGVDAFYTDLRKFSVPTLQAGGIVFTTIDARRRNIGRLNGAFLRPLEAFSPALRTPEQNKALRALALLLPGMTMIPFPKGVPIDQLPIPTAVSQSFGDPNGKGNYKFLSAYIQDDIRLKPNLVIKGGVRYDLNAVKFSPDTKLSFSPRLAIAYQPTKLPNLNIRAAYGIFVGSPLAGIIFTSEISGRLQNITVPFPFSILAYETLVRKKQNITDTKKLPFFPQFSQAFAVDKNLRNSYAQQATLAVDYSFDRFTKLSLSYNYVRGIKLFGSRDINAVVRPIPGDPIRSIIEGRLDRTKGNIFELESAFDSYYSAFTALIDRRFTRRLGILAHYTYAKAIDNSVDFFPLFQEIANPLQPGAERGLSIQDVRNRFVTSALWDLTYSKNVLLRNYKVSTIITLSSGQPYNLLAGVDVNGNGDFPPADRPLNIGRNSGITPGLATFDIRLTRSFSPRENCNIQGFVEVFNLFNRVNIDPSQINRIFLPDRDNGTFDLPKKENGLFTLPKENARGGFSPRQFQIGLRVSF